MNDVSSPLLQKASVTLKEVILSRKIEELYLKRFDIKVEFDVEKIYKYECQKSGYQFFYPFDLAGGSLFYEQLQKFDWYYMPWKWEHEKAEEHISQGNRVLEVGSGNSSFVEYLAEKDIETTGLELNQDAVNTAKEKGLNVLEETIEAHSLKFQNHYDIVCSFQVLEHIAHVHSFLNGMIKCLKPGGTLIICVPNNQSFIKNVDWHLLNMPPHHMGLWNKKSLSYLPEIFPVQKLKLLNEPLQSYHYSYYQGVIEKRIGETLIIRSIYYRFRFNRLFSVLIPRIAKYIRGQSIMAVYKKNDIYDGMGRVSK